VLERVIPYLSGKKHDIRTSEPAEVHVGTEVSAEGYNPSSVVG
jgi:hypothetical protein